MARAAVDLNPNDFNAVIKVLADEYDGDSAAMLADLRRGQKTTTKPPPVQPRSAGEVVALLESGILNQTEARRYLGLKPSGRAKALAARREPRS